MILLYSQGILYPAHMHVLLQRSNYDLLYSQGILYPAHIHYLCIDCVKIFHFMPHVGGSVFRIGSLHAVTFDIGSVKQKVQTACRPSQKHTIGVLVLWNGDSLIKPSCLCKITTFLVVATVGIQLDLLVHKFYYSMVQGGSDDLEQSKQQADTDLAGCRLLQCIMVGLALSLYILPCSFHVCDLL